jgi:hypothetical protein
VGSGTWRDCSCGGCSAVSGRGPHASEMSSYRSDLCVFTRDYSDWQRSLPLNSTISGPSFVTASRSQPLILCARWFVLSPLDLFARALMLRVSGISIGFQRVLCLQINLASDESSCAMQGALSSSEQRRELRYCEDAWRHHSDKRRFIVEMYSNNDQALRCDVSVVEGS